jgi:hypothetical protein
MKSLAAQRAGRAYYERNMESVKADAAARYAADPETAKARSKEWARKNPEKRREIVRKASQGQDVRRLKRNHGLTPDQFEAIWRAQEGCCYLCERSLADALWAIDHDHRCCPAGKSCDNCRRGIAHRPCNAFIGLFGDNPDLIERIAANLRAAERAGV